jgi:EAL domain-containing protein (putative c-di-GMP-specific phosphodiesterase class I)/CHASE2 domain-containing sensor protein
MGAFWPSLVKRARSGGKKNPQLRLFLWAAILGLIFGGIEFGKPLDDTLRTNRNIVRAQKASGDIVLVAIDDPSLASVEKWPWPRRYHAQLARTLDQMGAKRILFDIDFSSRSNREDDVALEEVFSELGHKITVPVQYVTDPLSGVRTEVYPMADFRRHVGTATVNLKYDSWGTVWKLPYALDMEGTTYTSFASLLSSRSGPSGSAFPLDYSIDPSSIPAVGAADVLHGKAPPNSFAGKDVIVGTTSRQLGDTFRHPSRGVISGVYLHILGAETLKAGTPMELGWVPAFVVALVIAGAALRFGDVRVSVAASITGVATTFALPFVLEAHLIFIDVAPALFVLLVVGSIDGWRKLKHSYSLRAKTNAVSGLPNLDALREQKPTRLQPLIAARIQNYPEINSALPQEDEKMLVDQIALRLTLGAPGLKLYQGDEGIFAWFAEPASLSDHLDALHALFRSPVIVAGNPLDLTITFGIDAGSDRSLANRLGSALVAADEAAGEGLRWKEYDPAKLKDAAWKLSLLSQLDAAIDAGDLWIAYQPKLDLASGTITGAEALVRWTHPEKGPISPVEFVIAAEQSDRIQKLTSFVLEQAIAGAAALNSRGLDFEISVNLSARLVDDPSLTHDVRGLLTKYGLPAERLTLEVTETVALTGNGNNFRALRELRESGVRLAIDDYGTGLSTLEYLKKIPATEIKIDKSFIQSVGNSRSDMLMVHSTIQLAHSLGQKVVAEGVEEPETLELIKKLGCDVAQGYLIGRPMTYRALSRQVLTQLRRDAA